MEDSVPITPGSGSLIATDLASGVNFQRFKLTTGAAGVDGGLVTPSNPLPVTLPTTLTTEGQYLTTLPTLTNGQISPSMIDSSGRSITTLGTALSQAIDSVLTYSRGSNYQELSTSGLVLTGAGKLTGIFVASGTSPTVKIWDNTSAATTVLLDTFTVATPPYYIELPYVRCINGLYATLGGTNPLITIFYDPTTT
jgi:hypothetical protein